MIHLGGRMAGNGRSIVVLFLVTIAVWVWIALSSPVVPPAEQTATPAETEAGPQPPPKPALTRVQAPAVPPKPAVQKVPAPEARKLGSESLKAGRVPSFQGELRVPFAQYEAFIRRGGGALALYDRTRKQLIGEVQGSRIDGDVKTGAYHPRARDVTADVPQDRLDELLRQAREGYGDSAFSVLALLPSSSESEFVGSIRRVVEAAGVNWGSVDNIRVAYLAGSERALYFQVLDVGVGGRRRELGVRVAGW